MGIKAEVRVLAVAFLTAACAMSAGTRLTTANRDELGWTWMAIYGLCTGVLTLATLLCLDIWRLKPADSHTLQTLYSQYKMILRLRLTSPYHWWIIRQLTIDPKKTSEKALLRILNLNKNTEYGKKYHLKDIKSREEFVLAHPLTHYDHYRDYIQRTIDGEDNIIFPSKPVYVAKTSGTTGAPKLFPYPEIGLRKCGFIFSCLFSSSFVHLMNLKRSTRFYLFSPLQMTPAGVPIGITGMVMGQVSLHNLTPGINCKLYKEEASYYVQGLFSLAERELQYINGFSSDLMYCYMKFIMLHHESMCDDIARGEVGTAVDIPEDIRQVLSENLKADPKRAAELREEFKKGAQGLVKRIWKDLDFVIMSSSASFKMCATLLSRTYMKGVKSMIHGHGSSEGLSGINFESEPGEGDYITVTNYPCFIEYISLENVEAENPNTLFTEQIEVGKQYEMVVTVENGLYRYRTGDIIKVVGFTNKTPKYELMFRLGQRLSISYEKTPDKFIYEAMELCKALLPADLDLLHFTSTESFALESLLLECSTSDYKGHYVVFIEVDSSDIHVDTNTLAKEFDSNLAKLYNLYGEYRATGTIGLPRLIQTEAGTFECVRQLLLTGKANSQFKFPRVLRNDAALEYLFKNRVQSRPNNG